MLEFVTIPIIWVCLFSPLWLELEAWLSYSTLLVYSRLSRLGGWWVSEKHWKYGSTQASWSWNFAWAWQYFGNIWTIFDQYLDNIWMILQWYWETCWQYLDNISMTLAQHLTIFGKYFENIWILYRDNILTICGQYLDHIYTIFGLYFNDIKTPWQ